MPDSGHRMRSAFRPPASACKGYHKLDKSTLPSPMIPFYTWMGIAPHNIISTKHQKCRGCVPRGCRTIINKREGGTLYQKKRNPWLLIPRPLRTFGKQPGPTGVTKTMLLWFLPAQDSTHDLCNTKQMAKKTNPYWKKQTWTQPTTGYMQMRQPRWHALQ